MYSKKGEFSFEKQKLVFSVQLLGIVDITKFQKSEFEYINY